MHAGRQDSSSSCIIHLQHTQIHDLTRVLCVRSCDCTVVRKTTFPAHLHTHLSSSIVVRQSCNCTSTPMRHSAVQEASVAPQCAAHLVTTHAWCVPTLHTQCPRPQVTASSRSPFLSSLPPSIPLFLNPSPTPSLPLFLTPSPTPSLLPSRPPSLTPPSLTHSLTPAPLPPSLPYPPTPSLPPSPT